MIRVGRRWSTRPFASIGLREEGWKAILFLPLLPALLRRGSRIEAMTCGALVGLGFAAEENIGYFERGADVALSRFLTANLPMSSLVSIILLVVIAQRFLRQLLIASSREDERDALNLFVASMAAITGAAYIYASTQVGPLEAFRLIALGTLSVAVVIFIFVRELRPS